MRRRALISRLALCASLLAGAACEHQQAKHGQPSAPAIDFARPYSPGSWRLAPATELEHTVLTVAVIRVEHSAEAASTKNAFTTRTRAEARALALDIAKRVHADPAQFAELARKYSDDVRSKQQGGALGTVPALALPPHVLDALNALQVGSTSRVIDAPEGFVILRLLETPAAVELSARRVVIGYQGGPQLRVRPGRAVRRSRDEAEQLIAKVLEEARLHPDTFPALVDLYSDHADALRAGDMGAWSSHGAFDREAETRALLSMAVGEARAVEGAEGLSVLQRTENSVREELAVTSFRVPVGRASGHARAALPRDLARFMRGRATDFDVVQQRYGGAGSYEQWTSGSGDPRAEQAISKLAIGEASRAPLELTPGVFTFNKRLAPKAKTVQAPFATALPTATQADVDALVASSSGEAVAGSVAALRVALGPSLGLQLGLEQTRRVKEIADALEEALRAADGSERARLVQQARANLKQALGAENFKALQANIQSALKRQLLTQR